MIRSFLFRTIIIALSIWIVIHKEGCHIPLLAYLIIVLLYILAYLQLKKHEKSLFRLLLDYIFINVVIYQADLNSPVVFLLIILPIINAINFTGKTSHFLLLIIMTCLTFFIHGSVIGGDIILSIIALSVIYMYSIFKFREWKIEKDISQQIDAFFLNPERIEKTHHIYRRIIELLNKYFFNNEKFGIECISAYTLKENTLWLINSSEFSWERQINLSEQDVSRLRLYSTLDLENNIKLRSLYYIRRDNIEYVFCCEMEKSLTLIIHNYRKILKLTFSKASLLLNADYRIRNMRDKKFNEIKDNVLYVNQAIKVMHYIRNKMTPLSNIVTYHKISDNIEDSIKLKMKRRIEKEALQADSDLKEIINFANYLLDKRNNPFVKLEQAEVTISKLFIVLSEIVESQLSDIVYVDSQLKDLDHNKYVSYINLIECKIMFTDWITNMVKYRNNYHKISMGIQEGKLIFHFENDFSCSNDEVLKLVRDLNSTGKDAVIEGKGKGHGIYIIKGIANKLGIDILSRQGNILEYGNIICMDFKFSIYEK